MTLRGVSVRNTTPWLLLKINQGLVIQMMLGHATMSHLSVVRARLRSLLLMICHRGTRGQTERCMWSYPMFVCIETHSMSVPPQTCVVDILRHVPRCVFSDKDNAVIHWALLALGVNNVPSERSMKDVRNCLQRVCGIQSIRYQGALGNLFYVNDFAAIIAQVSPPSFHGTMIQFHVLTSNIGDSQPSSSSSPSVPSRRCRATACRGMASKAMVA